MIFFVNALFFCNIIYQSGNWTHYCRVANYSRDNLRHFYTVFVVIWDFCKHIRVEHWGITVYMAETRSTWTKKKQKNKTELPDTHGVKKIKSGCPVGGWWKCVCVYVCVGCARSVQNHPKWTAVRAAHDDRTPLAVFPMPIPACDWCERALLPGFVAPKVPKWDALRRMCVCVCGCALSASHTHFTNGLFLSLDASISTRDKAS